MQRCLLRMPYASCSTQIVDCRRFELIRVPMRSSDDQVERRTKTSFLVAVLGARSPSEPLFLQTLPKSCWHDVHSSPKAATPHLIPCKPDRDITQIIRPRSLRPCSHILVRLLRTGAGLVSSAIHHSETFLNIHIRGRAARDARSNHGSQTF